MAEQADRRSAPPKRREPAPRHSVQRHPMLERRAAVQPAAAYGAMLNARPAGPRPIQRASNRTGLPDRLKAGVEALSGLSMDAVKVHYGSSKPAELDAHAFAQGDDIHLAPGQEQHLPHEAWHVVQQAQGRVKATAQMKSGVALNDDAGLEREADAMGARAAAGPATAVGKSGSSGAHAGSAAHQLKPVQLNGDKKKKKSGGSSKANKALVSSMGKSASRVDKVPKAKPHTATGTGSSGTDHQGRNAMVINKAKQDTKLAHQDPTMFSSSRMRTDDKAVEKDKVSSEKREEKKVSAKASKDALIREMFGYEENYEITKDDRKAYEEIIEVEKAQKEKDEKEKSDKK